MKEIDERGEDSKDLSNYRGAFYNNNKAAQSTQDSITGAHFEYLDMCERLRTLERELRVMRDPEEDPQEMCEADKDDVADEDVGPDPMQAYKNTTRKLKLISTLAKDHQSYSDHLHTWAGPGSKIKGPQPISRPIIRTGKFLLPVVVSNKKSDKEMCNKSLTTQATSNCNPGIQQRNEGWTSDIFCCSSYTNAKTSTQSVQMDKRMSDSAQDNNEKLFKALHRKQEQKQLVLSCKESSPFKNSDSKRQIIRANINLVGRKECQCEDHNSIEARCYIVPNYQSTATTNSGGSFPLQVEFAKAQKTKS